MDELVAADDALEAEQLGDAKPRVQRDEVTTDLRSVVIQFMKPSMEWSGPTSRGRLDS